jgi:hypothetical protein
MSQVAIVHRYLKADQHDHFYTANAAEIGTTTPGQTGNHGYAYESSSFSVFTHPHHGLVPVYRYLHAGHHDHFYTSNAGEIGAVNPGQAGNHGYVCEGILGYVSPHEFPGSVPIYRYWNEQTHDHFYTANAAEIGTTQVGQTGNHGYKFEGIVGYGYAADPHFNVVHRYYHEGHHDHFYTADGGEIGTTEKGHVGNHGYKSEGPSFYIFTHQHHGLVPVYRYWKEDQHDHFYTANVAEIGATNPGQVGNHGYKCEGILGYVSPTEFYGSIPIYRYNHEQSHDHFYTSNAAEIGTTHPGQVGNHGYKCEGILGYVPHH